MDGSAAIFVYPGEPDSRKLRCQVWLSIKSELESDAKVSLTDTLKSFALGVYQADLGTNTFVPKPKKRQQLKKLLGIKSSESSRSESSRSENPEQRQAQFNQWKTQAEEVSSQLYLKTIQDSSEGQQGSQTDPSSSPGTNWGWQVFTEDKWDSWKSILTPSTKTTKFYALRDSEEKRPGLVSHSLAETKIVEPEMEAGETPVLAEALVTEAAMETEEAPAADEVPGTEGASETDAASETDEASDITERAETGEAATSAPAA